MIFIETDVFKPLERRIVSEREYARLIDFLTEWYPSGFGAVVDITVNGGAVIGVDDYDMVELSGDDVVVLVRRPAVTAAMVGGYSIVAWVANLAINVAAGYLLGRIFAPDGDSVSRENNTASPVYSLNAQQNETKLGLPIPVSYGTVRMYPPMISQPYYKYVDGDEYLYHLLCIGQGEYGVESIMIGDQDVSGYPNDIEYRVLNGIDFANIEHAVDDPEYKATVKTLSNPSGLSLENNAAVFYEMAFYGDVQKLNVFNGEDDLGLVVGSKITITWSFFNNGEYTVSELMYHSDLGLTEVYVEETVVNEPFVVFPDYSTHNGVRWEDSVSTPLYELAVGSNFYCYENTQHYKIVEQFEEIVDDGGILGERTYYITVTDYAAPSGLATLITTSKLAGISSVTESGRYEINGDAEFIELDYVYGGGLYSAEESTGKFYANTVVWNVNYYGDGVLLGVVEVEDVGSTATPLRKTLRLEPIVGTDEISFTRISPSSSWNNIVDAFVIHRVKEIYPSENSMDYGDITLLWVKLRATNAISAQGQLQVNGWFKRLDVANDMRSVLTDIYTNDVYGGRLAPEDLDFPQTDESVNGSFDAATVIYDAMNEVATAQRYHLYPVGQSLLLKYDDVATVVLGLYNETNILQDSISTSFIFDEENVSYDGFKCTYYNDTDWLKEEIVYPTGAMYPQVVELFGVTSETQAEKMAMYLWKQDRARRKVITFKTDIQGLVPQFLDRILISHSSLNWGSASQVRSVNGSSVELIDPIKTDGGSVSFRAADGSVETMPATIVDECNITVLGLPDWVGEDTFCTVGVAREFLVMSVRPQGDEVEVTVVNYDEGVYE